MTDKLQQIIKEEIEKLPKEAQDAINSFEWENIAEEIGKKYLLGESEINELQVEILLVLVGLTDSQFYVTTIENEIGLTKDEATKISNEVFEKIFVPISNAIEENIKKNLPNKNPNWKQSLDFILSGGDYSAFITPPNSPLEEYSDLRSEGGGRISPSPLQGEGSGVRSIHPGASATPQEGNIKPTVLKDNLVI